MGELNFLSPVDAPESRGYKKGVHHGIDYDANFGTHVRASEGGVVVEVPVMHKEYGIMVVIDHTPDADEEQKHVYTLYGHLDSKSVGRGKRVRQGQVIGSVGRTGRAYSTTGGDPAHLHFEVAESRRELSWRYENTNKTGIEPGEHRVNPKKRLKGAAPGNSGGQSRTKSHIDKIIGRDAHTIPMTRLSQADPATQYKIKNLSAGITIGHGETLVRDGGKRSTA